MAYRDKLRQVLEGVARGEKGVEEAMKELSRFPFEDLGFAKPDHHRRLRHGLPEVVLCQGKVPEHIPPIVRSLLREGGYALLTRVSEEMAEMLLEEFPGSFHHPQARLMIVGERPAGPCTGLVAVASGGSADYGVAEEARITAELMGAKVVPLYDVGVAGAHRLFAHREVLEEARVVVAVAGMEGALPSLVAGLASCPVIGVPTSTGYGASLGGLAALLAMLNSCAPGVAVVNVDNGFGAGFLAGLINRMGGGGGQP